jgi:hypothetical protein
MVGKEKMVLAEQGDPEHMLVTGERCHLQPNCRMHDKN